MVSFAQARIIGIGLLSAILSGNAAAAPVHVVEAETVYGDIAAQIGGDAVSVVSILNNPAQDPHEFEASASAARSVADADLVIYNGAHYDPWMDKLLAASPNLRRKVIIVADADAKGGDNPHLWYQPAIIPAVAEAIRADLAAADGSGADGYRARTQAFLDALAPVIDKVRTMQGRYRSMPITATEPVFDLMAQEIGLDVRNAGFERAVMNGTEPSARDVAAFESDLRNHRVKALLYNTQSGGALSQRMKAIAEAEKIPVVGIGETLPQGMHYQDWVLGELNALDSALSGATQ